MDDLAQAADIEGLVQGLLDAAGAPGAAVALTVDGEAWSAGVGHADPEHCQPLPASARFSLYSITKTVLATIVLRLVEDGLFALDDPMQEFLPGIEIETPVSIRQLLNHTGGIPDYGSLASYHDAIRDHPETPWTDREFLAGALSNGLLFMPGHGWRYSNIGYMLIRLILENETGLRFPAVIRHCLTLPFGLHEMTTVNTLDDVSTLVPGYSSILSQDGALENVIPRYAPGWVAHGLVSSTAAETARFLDLLFAGALFEAPLLTDMLTGAPVAERHPWMVKPSYGLGLMMDPGSEYGVAAGHTGGGPGYSTAAYHYPSEHGHRVTCVALVNRDGNDLATDIVFTIAARLAGHL